MEELIHEVEEYFENNNNERFGYCPLDNNDRVIKEELIDLYIDTYKKVVKYTRDVMIIEDSENEAWERHCYEIENEPVVEFDDLLEDYLE